MGSSRRSLWCFPAYSDIFSGTVYLTASEINCPSLFAYIREYGENGRFSVRLNFYRHTIETSAHDKATQTIPNNYIIKKCKILTYFINLLYNMYYMKKEDKTKFDLIAEVMIERTSSIVLYFTRVGIEEYSLVAWF